MGNCIVKNGGGGSSSEERYLGVNKYYDTMSGGGGSSSSVHRKQQQQQNRSRNKKNEISKNITSSNVEFRDPFSYYEKADRTENESSVSSSIVATLTTTTTTTGAQLDKTMPLSPDTLSLVSPLSKQQQQQQKVALSTPSSPISLNNNILPITPSQPTFSSTEQQQQLQLQQIVPFVSPESQQQQQQQHPHMDDIEEDDLVSPLSSDILGVTATATGSRGAIVPYVPSSSSSSPSRRGRALQARLQKARYMQMAFASETSSVQHHQQQQQSSSSLHHNSPQQLYNNNVNNNHHHHHHHPRSTHSFDYPIPERTNSSRSIASSTITDSCATASIMSGFEEYSTISHILDADNDPTSSTTTTTPTWVDIELGSTIVCTAMSRTPITSIVEQTPPLYIAIGTESGLVLVQEILPPSPKNSPTGNIITTTNIGMNDNSNNLDNGYTIPAAVMNNTRSHPNHGDNTTLNDKNYNKEGEMERKLGVATSVQHHGRIRCVDFSPDGQYLAVGGDDCKCHIYQLVYEMDDNEILQFTSLHWVLELERVDRVYSVQFSPDSKYFAVGGFDGTVAIYNADDIPNETIAMESIVEIIRDALIMTIDWSPDSRYLAIGGSDRSCAIIDCQQSWNVFREIRRSATIQAVRWYPGTGKHLAILCSDTVAIIAGKDSFLQTNEINLRKGTSNARTRREYQSKYKDHSICWSPNGSFLIVSGPDCALYETKKFTLVHKIPRPCNVTTVSWGHHSGIPGDGILPRRFLAIGGDDGKVSILKGGLEANMSGEASSVGGDDMSSMADSSNVSALGDWILKENIFQDTDDIIDINVNIDEHKAATKSTTNPMVLVVAFARGSKSKPSLTFAHTTDDGLVTIRNCIDWKILAEIQFPKPIETMSYSFGSRYLALGCADSNVYISDTASNWELIAKIEFTTPISTVQFECKNNERLVVGCVDGTLAFLDPRKGYEFVGEIVTSVGAPITTIDWSTKNLAVGRNDGTVLIYDSYEVLKEVYTPIVELERSSSVCALSFGVSSRFLAVGDASGLIGIYSSKGGWVLCHQIDMDCGISSIQWCPLGRHLAFIADNGAMNVIDTIFWADVREIESASPPLDHGNVIRSSLSFSQDGKLLAFCRSDIGFGILDSTTKWSFALNMLIEPLTEIDSEPETSNSKATTSSMEGLTADDEGFYEV